MDPIWQKHYPAAVAAETLARYDAEVPRWRPGPLRSDATATAFLRRLDELALRAAIDTLSRQGSQA
mgnify:CR=1 FL=1